VTRLPPIAVLGLVLALPLAAQAAGPDDVRQQLGQGWTFLEAGSLSQAEDAFTRAFEDPVGRNTAEVYYAISAVWWERRNAMAAYLWLSDAIKAKKDSFTWDGGPDGDWDDRLQARLRFMETNFTVVKLRSPSRGKPLPPLADPAPADPVLREFGDRLPIVIAEGVEAKVSVQWVTLPNGTYWVGDELKVLDSGEMDANKAIEWQLPRDGGKARKAQEEREALIASGQSPAKAERDRMASAAELEEARKLADQAEAERREQARQRDERDAAERAAAEAARATEEARLAEQRRREDERRAAARADEERLAEARRAEERRADEERRAAERQAQQEAARRADEERRQQEARVAEERRLADERRAAERAEDERQAAARRAEERRADERRSEEEARLAAERRAEEEARLAAERASAEEARLAEQRAQDDRDAAARRRDAERAAAERERDARLAEQRQEEARLAEQRLADERARRGQDERAAADRRRREEARLADEQRRQAEIDRDRADRDRAEADALAERLRRDDERPDRPQRPSKPKTSGETAFLDRRGLLSVGGGVASVTAMTADGSRAEADWTASGDVAYVAPLPNTPVGLAVGVSLASLPVSGCAARQTRGSAVSAHVGPRIPVALPGRAWLSIRVGAHLGGLASWPVDATRQACAEDAQALGASEVAYGARLTEGTSSGRVSYGQLGWTGYGLTVGPDAEVAVLGAPGASKLFVGGGLFLRHDQVFAVVQADDVFFADEGGDPTALVGKSVSALDGAASMARFQFGVRAVMQF